MTAMLGVDAPVVGYRREASWGQVDPEKFQAAASKAGRLYAKGRRARAFKRGGDIAFSLMLLVLFAPLLAATALAIKLESKGPVFYRQVRVGRGGKLFRILKFRSMRADAETSGARWAAENDDRVTRVGRFIRRMRIDEIPQAVNVLRGEMSFVGPRPERPEFVTLLRERIPHYDERHLVKPGITGWAQVNYAYGASIDDAREKLKYDLYYLENFSILLDVEIILRTVRVAIAGVGAR